VKDFGHKRYEMIKNFVKIESLGPRKPLLNTVTFIKVMDKVCPTFGHFSVHEQNNADI